MPRHRSRARGGTRKYRWGWRCGRAAGRALVCARGCVGWGGRGRKGALEMVCPASELLPVTTGRRRADFFNASKTMVGATGIEPVTPTMSTYAHDISADGRGLPMFPNILISRGLWYSWDCRSLRGIALVCFPLLPMCFPISGAFALPYA